MTRIDLYTMKTLDDRGSVIFDGEDAGVTYRTLDAALSDAEASIANSGATKACILDRRGQPVVTVDAESRVIAGPVTAGPYKVGSARVARVFAAAVAEAAACDDATLSHRTRKVLRYTRHNYGSPEQAIYDGYVRAFAERFQFAPLQRRRLP